MEGGGGLFHLIKPVPSSESPQIILLAHDRTAKGKDLFNSIMDGGNTLELEPRHPFFLDDFQHGIQIFSFIIFLELYEPKEVNRHKSK